MRSLCLHAQSFVTSATVMKLWMILVSQLELIQNVTSLKQFQSQRSGSLYYAPLQLSMIVLQTACSVKLCLHKCISVSICVCVSVHVSMKFSFPRKIGWGCFQMSMFVSVSMKSDSWHVTTLSVKFTLMDTYTSMHMWTHQGIPTALRHTLQTYGDWLRLHAYVHVYAYT